MFKKNVANQGFAMLIPVLIVAAVALTAIGATVYVTRKPQAKLSLGKASVTQGKGEERIVTIPFILHFKSLNAANKAQFPYIRCSHESAGLGESDTLPTDQEEVTGAITVIVKNPDIDGTVRYYCREEQTQASAEVAVNLRSFSTEPTTTPTPTEPQKTEKEEKGTSETKSSEKTNPPETLPPVAEAIQKTTWHYFIDVGGGSGGDMIFKNVSESGASGPYTESGPLGVETKSFTATFAGGNHIILTLPDTGEIDVTISSDGKSMSGQFEGGLANFTAKLKE